MKPEEITVGKTYNVRVRVSQIHTPSSSIYCCTLAPNDKEVSIASFRITEAAAFYSINPVNGIKNTEPAPKYDPCRPFKAGDIVEPCQVKGRWLAKVWEERKGMRCIVMEDETWNGNMVVKDPCSQIDKTVDAVYFQLVTPVEELEPYSVHVGNYEGEWGVYRDWAIETQELIVSFSHRHPHAKEAAEAECDRLNEEHRKEKSND